MISRKEPGQSLYKIGQGWRDLSKSSINYVSTRNTLRVTSPPSQVHNERTVPIIRSGCMGRMHETAIFPLPLLNLTPTSCSSAPISLMTWKFGDSAINKGYIALFHCACAKRPYFHFRSKILRHHDVPGPRFPKRRKNSRTFKQI